AAAHEPEYREAFDVVAARAVTRLNRLVEWTLPFARRGGVCIAMKGPDVLAELEEASSEIARHGGGTPSVTRFELPIAPVGRSLVVIPKQRPTPPEPRPGRGSPR